MADAENTEEKNVKSAIENAASILSPLSQISTQPSLLLSHKFFIHSWVMVNNLHIWSCRMHLCNIPSCLLKFFYLSVAGTFWRRTNKWTSERHHAWWSVFEPSEKCFLENIFEHIAFGFLSLDKSVATKTKNFWRLSQHVTNLALNFVESPIEIL